MFNLGLPELIIISVAVLLVFGPKRLPELAKGLGKGIRDFKKALDGSEDKEELPPSNPPHPLIPPAEKTKSQDGHGHNDEKS